VPPLLRADAFGGYWHITAAIANGSTPLPEWCAEAPLSMFRARFDCAPSLIWILPGARALDLSPDLNEWYVPILPDGP
jgi:hypothetical protein